MSSTRLHPEWRDPRWSVRDDLEAAYETIRQAGRCWAPEVRQLAGVLLSVDRDGSVSAAEGLVRVEDQKRVDAFLKQRRAEAQNDGDGENGQDVMPARVSVSPKAVNRDLTLVRTRALRLALSGDADIAPALCVASMVIRAVHHSEMIGVAIHAQQREVDDLPDLQEAWAEMEGRLPEDEIALLDWALGLSRERLLAVLAVLVAGSVDLAHEHTSPADLRKQAIANRLVQHLDIDMRKFWTAGLDYWVRLPKSALLAAMADAPSMMERSNRTREEALKACAKLRKDDLAAKVASAFEGSVYLPEILATPVEAGGLEMTSNGLAAIASHAVAAE